MSHSNSDDEDATGSPTKKIKYSSLNPESEAKIIREEKFLFELFFDVFKFIKDYFSVEEELITDSIYEIRRKFTQFDYLKTDFSKIENLCAYFYSHSTLNAALARSRILDVLYNCKSIQDKIHKTEINIVSLGSGPGTDILGFCSALEEYTDENYKEKIFNITAVDNVKRWSSFSYFMYFKVLEGDYGNVSTFFKKHDVSPSFMCVDLFSNRLPSKYENDLKQSDIILLSRVLDAQNWSEKDPNRVLQILIPRMNKNALLLIIDSFSKEFQTYGLREIYAANLPDFELIIPPSDRQVSTNSRAKIRVYERIKSQNSVDEEMGKSFSDESSSESPLEESG